MQGKSSERFYRYCTVQYRIEIVSRVSVCLCATPLFSGNEFELPVQGTVPVPVRTLQNF